MAQRQQQALGHPRLIEAQGCHSPVGHDFQQQLGLIPGGIRLPLTTLSEASQPRVLAALRQAGLIA